MEVRCIQCGPAVNESERKALERIKGSLLSEPGDDEWFILTNLAFSATDRFQSDEIDIVAVGPPGVQVIEVKHWSAAWANRNPGLVEEEAERVTMKAKKVGTFLRKRVADLGRVNGVFLVTESEARAGPLRDRGPVRGIPFHTLKDWAKAVGLRGRKALTPGKVQELRRALEPRGPVIVNGTPSRVAGYARIEVQSAKAERFHRVCRATHPSRQENVVLHLYDLSAVDDAKAEDRARREWEALRRLQIKSWVPRVIDSFQEVPGYQGELSFFTLADPAAPDVAERSGDGAWDTDARLRFAHETVRALRNLHEGSDPRSDLAEAPMLHRNLTPRTILVRHDNTPLLTAFDLARIPVDTTMAHVPPGEDPTVAPEVRAQGLGAAGRPSDTYSLCASLACLFEGREDADSRGALEALSLGQADDPGSRCSLADLEGELSRLLGENGSEVPQAPQADRQARQAPAARYWSEDQEIDFRGRRYRIVSRLGTGGTGTAFKVVHVDAKTGDELGVYVGKAVHDEENGRRVLHAYELARSHLARHRSLSAIFETSTEWRDNGFVALMTWVEGTPLIEWAGLLELWREEHSEESVESLVVRWLGETLDALEVLHDNGLVHGDVSPRNMILSEGGIVLTDFDCVVKVGMGFAAAGTVPYCSPSVPEGGKASPSDDIYALAASVFHVIFGREPFGHGGDRDKARGINWEGLSREEFPLLADFLDRATNPDPKRRLASVEEAREALSPSEIPTEAVERVADDVPPPVPAKAETAHGNRQENEVTWLRHLLQSYPGSRWGNSETRGLDSDFAGRTYEETELEETLLDRIRDGNLRLAVLCGNAGDGKTALLQHLANRLGLGRKSSADRVVEGRLDTGAMLRVNFDGSASQGGRSADDLLDEFLAPFRDGVPGEDIVHLLAINDGRLLEWIAGHEEETRLTRTLSERLQGQEPSPDSHVLFVDLNDRSLVGTVADGGVGIDTGFLHRLVDKLYGGSDAESIWEPCRGCSAQDRCEVYRATKLFGPGNLSDPERRARARDRLFDALQAVHLRGESHITVRELRAALSYILFGIHYCSDYHNAGEGQTSDDWRSYAERAFSPTSPGRQGDVLRELPCFDPALEGHPIIDRRLCSSGAEDDIPPGLRYSDLGLGEARRRAYFEWSEERIDSCSGDDPGALMLADGRHLTDFRDLAGEGNHEELTRRLCGGIARLETLPPLALERLDQGAVPLKITPRTPTETAFWVEKDLSCFRLEAVIPDVVGARQLHREVRLTYRYRGGRTEEMTFGADLFDLLLEISDGYQLGDIASDDTFARLSIFVQRLVQEDDRTVFAWNPREEGRIYKVSARIDGAGEHPRQDLVISPLGGGS